MKEKALEKEKYLIQGCYCPVVDFSIGMDLRGESPIVTCKNKVVKEGEEETFLIKEKR